jgi:ferredoxin
MEKEKTPDTEDRETVRVYIMGKAYDVPSSLTIQKAMEFAGYQLIRGCGCRGGICGACGTVYRFPGSYKIEVGLACQTVVQQDMYLAQIPFFPANKATYDINELKPGPSVLGALYPEIYKCVGCNTCTRSCPMDINVMEYIAMAIRGNIAKCAEESFDCVMCGLCASRCPAEIVQYNVGIAARRIYALHIAPKAEHLENRVKEIEEGKYDEMIEGLMKTDDQELRRLYVEEREREPMEAPEDWMPEEAKYL